LNTIPASLLVEYDAVSQPYHNFEKRWFPICDTAREIYWRHPAGRNNSMNTWFNHITGLLIQIASRDLSRAA